MLVTKVVRRNAWGACLVVVGVLALGCSKPEEGGKVSLEDAPGVSASLVCDALYSCECAAQMAIYGSLASCESSVEAFAQGLLDAGVAEGYTYNETCIAELGDAYATIGCLAIDEVSYEVATDASFADAYANYAECKLFYGDGEAGENCTVFTYMQQPYGDSCVADLACNAGKCRNGNIYGDGGEGESCELATQNCTSGLACVPLETLTDTRCADLPGPGGTCLGIANACDSNSYCDQVSKKCTSLPGPGDACAPMGNPFAFDARCRYGSFCTGGSNDPGTCVALPDAGEPCEASTCAPGNYCDNNVCSPSPAAVCSASF